MNISKAIVLFFASLVIVYGCNKKAHSLAPLQPPSPSAPADSGWEFEVTPVWFDEFNKDGLPDTSKWNYDLGNNNGWGNNELEFYTADKNVIISNGILAIEARKERMEASGYTSARMVTKGKGDFLYGRFEVSAKLPSGKGLWPAIWMLPSDNVYGTWPKSGEIDIMEQVGFDPNTIHVSVHTEKYNHMIGTQKTSTSTINTATSDFHVYRVDWTPYAVRGFIDGNQVFQFTNEGRGPAYFPFNKKFHLILNVAVGGNWGGQQGVDDDSFPAKMEVDYVRVYKMKDK
jgi:beta-glucanase (GH16 family)